MIEHKCPERLKNAWGGQYVCGKPGKKEFQGTWYCGQHYNMHIRRSQKNEESKVRHERIEAAFSQADADWDRDRGIVELSTLLADDYAIVLRVSCLEDHQIPGTNLKVYGGRVSVNAQALIELINEARGL
jgi:hypothetical protein